MKTAITHFDGDPIVADFWLQLYDRYWRGEVDNILADVCINTEVVPQEAIDYQKELFAKFPEIDITFTYRPQIPEISNAELLKRCTADQILFIETDGLIFNRNLVASCFSKLDSHDMVASKYSIIPTGLQPVVEEVGYMRNFLFIKKSLLDCIDFDLMPKHLYRGMDIPHVTNYLDAEYDTDCFGWVALQLASLKPKVFWTPANYMVQDQALNLERYREYKWLHIRQFNSSNLGFSNRNFKYFATDNKKKIRELSKISQDHSEAEWQFTKSVFFRQIMLEAFQYKDKMPEFYDQYKTTLDTVIKKCKLPRERIAELRGFYRALINI